MTSAMPPAGPAAARSLYRSLLRTARGMPDDHRTAFVVHRVRSEFNKSERQKNAAVIERKLVDGQVYRDQLELQAQHLSELASQPLLIPVDLRSAASPLPIVSTSKSSLEAPTTSSVATDNDQALVAPSTRRGPSRPPRRSASPPSLAFPPPSSAPSPSPTTPSSLTAPAPPLDRRKLIRAFQARTAQSRAETHKSNRFMQGPEPSWVVARSNAGSSSTSSSTADMKTEPTVVAPPKSPRARRQRKVTGPDRLQELPLELLILITSHLDLASLLSLSLTSHSLRSLVLGPNCEALWLSAIEQAELPELEAPLRPVEYASLVCGRRCRVCGKNNARRVEYHLRTRLCTNCWDEQLVYEGPDEPDPAFEDFFPGTKRYTPRSRTGKGWKRHKTFFFLWLLGSTSTYLASLLAPQIALYEISLETDPLVELDDFLAFSALPPAVRRKLDERAEWVKKCWRDGEKLGEWEAGMKRRRRAELKDARDERKLAAEREASGQRTGTT